jgi:hypothetical protein
MISLIAYAIAPAVGEKVAKATAWGIVLLVAALAVWGAYCWAWDKGRDHERARWEAASAKVIAADVKADAVAIDTAATTKGKTDAVTEQARDDAAKSGDPLDAVSKRLRAESAGRGGEATR